MKFYYVNCDRDEGVAYHSTLASAKQLARETAANSYDDITVQVVEVSNDRATLLRLLNMMGGYTVFGAVVHTAKAKLKRGHHDVA